MKYQKYHTEQFQYPIEKSQREVELTYKYMTALSWFKEVPYTSGKI